MTRGLKQVHYGHNRLPWCRKTKPMPEPVNNTLDWAEVTCKACLRRGAAPAHK